MSQMGLWSVSFLPEEFAMPNQPLSPEFKQLNRLLAREAPGTYFARHFFMWFGIFAFALMAVQASHTEGRPATWLILGGCAVLGLLAAANDLMSDRRE